MSVTKSPSLAQLCRRTGLEQRCTDTPYTISFNFLFSSGAANRIVTSIVLLVVAEFGVRSDIQWFVLHEGDRPLCVTSNGRVPFENILG